MRDTDYRRLRLKDHPYGQANNTTGDESNDGPGPLKKLYVKISKWTPPEGEFPAADHYIGLSLWFVNSLDFNSSVTRRYSNNLSQTEIKASREFRWRTDVVMKPVNKGRAFVVWSRPLCIEEANGQLSDNRSTSKVSGKGGKHGQWYECQVRTITFSQTTRCYHTAYIPLLSTSDDTQSWPWSTHCL